MAARDVFGIVGTTQAGNFHVERVVAEGGFGVVYRAQHGAFRAPVALKCLKIPEEMTKPQRATFLEKFREEAELMFRLSAAITEVVRPLHVDVLLLGDGRFVPFLALEWLEGESLDGIITRRRDQGQAALGLHKVVKMLRPVASALSRAHRFPGPQGAVAIIHRDLKPENIFVASIGGTESMKILDFGIAKAKRAASQAVGRATGRSIAEDVSASFTPAYGAPEQWSPKTYGETGPWTDVWGLALSLVEALCGAPPLDGDTYVMRKACLDEKRRPTPRNLGADVPVEVEKVFERALAVDPRKRFKDIESFWSELEKAMGLEPSLRVRDARREPGEAEQQEPQPLPPMASPGARLARIDLLKVPSMAVARLPNDSPVPEPPRAARAEPPPGPPPRAPYRAAPAPTPPNDEDWSSLGLGDAPPSRPGESPVVRERTGSGVVRERTGGGVVREKTGGATLPMDFRVESVTMGETPGPPAQPAAARNPPPIRRASIGMELPLESRASSPDLEMSLPSHLEGQPEPASQRVVQAGPNPGPFRGAVASPHRAPSHSSMELEMSLPLHPEGQPPPASGPDPAHDEMPSRPPQAYGRRSSADLEESIPTMEAVPVSTSRPITGEGARRHSSASLELSLPTMAAAEAPGGRDPRDPMDNAMDFELGIPTMEKPAAAAAGSGAGRASGAGGAHASSPRLELAPQRPGGTMAPALTFRGPEPMSLRDRLKAPLTLLLTGLAVGVFDLAFHKISGNPLELGPVRLSWIAAPLALSGVGFLLWRLIGVHEDE